MQKWLIRLCLVSSGLLLMPITNGHAATTTLPAYDVSQWQSQFTPAQVQALKHEVSFMILRTQYGSQYQDRTFQQNVKLIRQAKIPYGVYSYSRYNSVAMARTEARSLYQSDPHALFYVNDIEENDAGSNLQVATMAWAQQMKALTKRPVVIYSDLSFMNTQIGNARTNYDAVWLASYSSAEPDPNYKYDLWQYTDHQSSSALGQNVDASIIPVGGKPLSFWTQTRGSRLSTKTVKKVATYHHQTQADKMTINSHYYSSKTIHELKVINPTGIQIYRPNRQVLMHCRKNTVIAVQRFQRVGHITRAITPNGNYFTANKKLVHVVK